MFENFKKKQKKASIQDEIQHILTLMSETDPSSKEYQELAGRLIQLREADSKPKHRFITGDGLLSTAGYLGGVLLIVNKENVGVVTSKALTLLPKLIK